MADGCTFTMDKIFKGERNNMLRSATEELKVEMKQERIREAESMVARINAYNERNKIPWRAGVSNFALSSYKDKKAFWNVSSLAEEKMTFGWEYYKGGILTSSEYDMYQYVDFIDEGSGKYVESFNWANRHGKNWNTPCEDQMWEETALPENKESYSCWAQGPKALLESYIKRYTGDHTRNERLSTQHIVSCSGRIAPDTTQGGWPSNAIRGICSNGVMSWDDMPFKYITYPCEKITPTPHKRFLPEEYLDYFGGDVDDNNAKKSRDVLMKSLVQYGPIALSHMKGKGGHTMLLSGWEVIKPGPFFLLPWSGKNILLEEDHPLVGKVAWIFKNSVGNDWGYNGYAYLPRSERSPKCPAEIHDSILPLSRFIEPYAFVRKLKYFEDGKEKSLEGVCVDEDGDGYYRWGLIGRPNNPDIPLEMDGDDSNPALGPMDEYGFCRELKKVDLYMRDTPQDKGIEPNDSGRDMWESPDIWIRNEANSTSEEHQNPQSGKRAYIHIRIHNKGTLPSQQNARVFVYWAKAGLYLRRTTFEGKENLRNPETNETYPAGGFIKSVAIPSIPARESTIVRIPWDLPDHKQYEKMTKDPWHYCLLAEIMSPTETYYSTDARELGSYVSRNNNVIQKNITIVETDPYAPHLGGRYVQKRIEGCVSIHNPTQKVSNLRVELSEVSGDAPITEEAEVSFKLNSVLQKACINVPLEGLRVIPDEARFIATAPVSKISEIRLAPGEIGILQVKFNFLAQKMTNKENFSYKVRLWDQDTGKVLGGETYIVRKSQRTPFSASIAPVTDGKLRAYEIGEPASYRWLDRDGKMLAEGREVEVRKLPLLTSREITLEVEAKADGFKDYDQKEQVSFEEEPQLLLTPIPAQNYLEIHYPAEAMEHLQIVITDMVQGKQEVQSIPGGWSSYRLDISTLAAGNYTLALCQEGNIIATRNFIKQ